ncbi:hypothetical protein K438DRAFT_1779478 [Mycena galopus ATCC 62051]|nr:hypothetical protein K438DRAFT_1779478 [Mycena galopus ATCC 62051]
MFYRKALKYVQLQKRARKYVLLRGAPRNTGCYGEGPELRTNILRDKPVILKFQDQELSWRPLYVSWLASGKRHPPFLQTILVQTLEAQPRSDSWTNTGVRAWFVHPFKIVETLARYTVHGVAHIVQLWRCQLRESSLFHLSGEPEMLLHSKPHLRLERVLTGVEVGITMEIAAMPDRLANPSWSDTRRELLRHRTSSNGESSTSRTPSTMRLRCSRSISPDEERDGLFALMMAESKSLAFTSLVHLFKETTSACDGLFLQVAVGYGGREEVVRDTSTYSLVLSADFALRFLAAA